MTRERKVNGRNHHIVMDILGLLLAVVVTGAGVQDHDGPSHCWNS